MTLEPILEVCHLSKSFGTHQVLRDVNFTVHPGDVTSILGSSGSGKSTLLRCINLLERPTAGQVVIDGQDLLELSAPPLREQRRSIRTIFRPSAPALSPVPAPSSSLPHSSPGSLKFSIPPIRFKLL